MKKKFQIDTQPFRSVEPKNSKESELIQINDIVVGAIGFQKNGYEFRPGTRQSKKDLVAFIAQEARIPNLRDFSAWKSSLHDMELRAEVGAPCSLRSVELPVTGFPDVVPGFQLQWRSLLQMKQ